MVVIDDKRFPGQYVITCDSHDKRFEFHAKNLDQAEKALFTHVSQEHSSTFGTCPHPGNYGQTVSGL